MGQLPFDSGRFIKLCFASFKFEMPLESSYAPHVKNIEFKGHPQIEIPAILLLGVQSSLVDPL